MWTMVDRISCFTTKANNIKKMALWKHIYKKAYIYICVRTKYKADLHFIYAEAEHVGNF